MIDLAHETGEGFVLETTPPTGVSGPAVEIFRQTLAESPPTEPSSGTQNTIEYGDLHSNHGERRYNVSASILNQKD